MLVGGAEFFPECMPLAFLDTDSYKYHFKVHHNQLNIDTKQDLLYIAIEIHRRPPSLQYPAFITNKNHPKDKKDPHSGCLRVYRLDRPNGIFTMALDSGSIISMYPLNPKYALTPEHYFSDKLDAFANHT